MGDSASFIESAFEFLMAGVLTLTSSLGIVWVTYPSQSSRIFLNQIEPFSTQMEPLGTQSLIVAFAVTVLTATSYALGVIVEYLARSVFEWRLDKIKAMRSKQFAREWRESIVDCNEGLPGKVIDRMVNSHGLMRFAVIYANQGLAREIDTQIRRLRLIRVLCLVEIAALYCFIVLTVRILEPPLVLLDLFLAVLAAFTLLAINNRFNRYCRAIERSFLLVSLVGLRSPDGAN